MSGNPARTCLEPNPENCRLLLLSIEKNGFGHVKLFPFALSNSIGSALFYHAHGSNGGIWAKRYDVLEKPNSYVVPTMRLDAVYREQIDFIKIDVEGAEYLALTGGEELITRFRPIIMSEFCLGMLEPVSGVSGSDFLHWIKNSGYRAYVLGRAVAPPEEIGDAANSSQNGEAISEWRILPSFPRNRNSIHDFDTFKGFIAFPHRRTADYFRFGEAVLNLKIGARKKSTAEHAS